jgi:hypothetical protein
MAGFAVGWFLIATAVLSIPSFVSVYGLRDQSFEVMVGVYVAIGAALLWAAGPRRGALALLAGSGGILLAVLYHVAVSGQGLAFYVSHGVGPTHVLWAVVLYLACLIAIVTCLRLARGTWPSRTWFIISIGVGIDFLMCGTLTGWQDLSILPWYDTSHPVSDIGLLAAVLVFWALAWCLWKWSWRGSTAPARPSRLTRSVVLGPVAGLAAFSTFWFLSLGAQLDDRIYLGAAAFGIVCSGIPALMTTRRRREAFSEASTLLIVLPLTLLVLSVAEVVELSINRFASLELGFVPLADEIVIPGRPVPTVAFRSHSGFVFAVWLAIGLLAAGLVWLRRVRNEPEKPYAVGTVSP